MYASFDSYIYLYNKKSWEVYGLLNGEKTARESESILNNSHAVCHKILSLKWLNGAIASVIANSLRLVYRSLHVSRCITTHYWPIAQWIYRLHTLTTVDCWWRSCTGMDVNTGRVHRLKLLHFISCVSNVHEFHPLKTKSSLIMYPLNMENSELWVVLTETIEKETNEKWTWKAEWKSEGEGKREKTASKHCKWTRTVIENVRNAFSRFSRDRLWDGIISL